MSESFVVVSGSMGDTFREAYWASVWTIFPRRCAALAEDAARASTWCGVAKPTGTFSNARGERPLPRIICVCDEYFALIAQSKEEGRLIEGAC